MPKLSIDEVIASIRHESIIADDAYGDAFDKKNTINDWIVYVGHYLSGATKLGTNHTERYTNLVKAGGLIINALRRLEDVPPRHYDEQPFDASDIPISTYIEAEGLWNTDENNSTRDDDDIAPPSLGDLLAAQVAKDDQAITDYLNSKDIGDPVILDDTPWHEGMPSDFPTDVGDDKEGL